MRCAPRAFQTSTNSTLLERIVRNLIENALRYTAKGGILIGLRQRGDRVKSTSSTRAWAFQPLSIRKSSRNSGSSIIQRATAARAWALVWPSSHVSRLSWAAEVQVRSRLARGSRFSLLLPLDRSAPIVLPAKQRSPIPAAAFSSSKTMSTVRASYDYMLCVWGYETLSTASGEEALDRAAMENWRFDAIIADHRLRPRPDRRRCSNGNRSPSQAFHSDDDCYRRSRSGSAYGDFRQRLRLAAQSPSIPTNCAELWRHRCGSAVVSLRRWFPMISRNRLSLSVIRINFFATPAEYVWPVYAVLRLLSGDRRRSPYGS